MGKLFFFSKISFNCEFSSSKKGLLLSFLPSSCDAAQVNVTVTSTNKFTPGLVRIYTGDSVQWTNEGGNHNVRADDDSFRCAESCDGDQDGTGNGTASSSQWVTVVTFASSGLYPYYCEGLGGPDLEGMSGAVYVEDPPPPPAESNAVLDGDVIVGIVMAISGGAIVLLFFIVVVVAAIRHRDAFIRPVLNLYDRLRS